jgi:hypothetical protein
VVRDQGPLESAVFRGIPRPIFQFSISGQNRSNVSGKDEKRSLVKVILMPGRSKWTQLPGSCRPDRKVTSSAEKARVHFIPALKGGVFVTLRAPEVRSSSPSPPTADRPRPRRRVQPPLLPPPIPPRLLRRPLRPPPPRSRRRPFLPAGAIFAIFEQQL